MTLTLTPDDGALLGRFADDRDERAFEDLVHRHGALVQGVAQRVLGDPADAEDATQAVFLTLARKAAELRHNRTIAPWLHHVTRCIARNALAARQSRTRHEQESAVSRETPSAEPPRDADLADLRQRLDQELARLPERYRAPLIIVHFEGRSLADTARLLQRPVGTIGACLSRGRELLRARLAGADPSALALLLVPGAPPEPSTISAIVHQVVATTSASSTVIALSNGVLRMLHLARLKTVFAAGLAVAMLAGGGAALVSMHAAESAETAGPAAVAAPAAHAADAAGEIARLQARLVELERSSVSFENLLRSGVLDVEHDRGDAPFLFNGAGQVSDDAVLLLHLQPAERSALDALFGERLSHLDDLLRRQGAHTTRDGTAWRIDLPVLGAAGQSERDLLIAGISGILGHDRGTLCWHILGRYCDDVFLEFCVHAQSLTLNWNGTKWACELRNNHGSWSREYTAFPVKFRLFKPYMDAVLPSGAAAPGPTSGAATASGGAGGF